jgi:hypothetical protein
VLPSPLTGYARSRQSRLIIPMNLPHTRLVSAFIVSDFYAAAGSWR